ncbi:hypothetical protein AgCh_004771 [Apium graveolens]
MGSIKAVAIISGNTNVGGSLQFVQDSSGSTHVKGKITGLSPGLHGFHIHALGDTTNGCISTGPHFNPLQKNHGAPTDDDRHAGDLGNVVASPHGNFFSFSYVIFVNFTQSYIFYISGIAEVSIVDSRV